jgi:hypothetical protein
MALKQAIQAERVRLGILLRRAYKQSPKEYVVLAKCNRKPFLALTSASVVECGCLGPTGASFAWLRFFHFTTVLGLMS